MRAACGAGRPAISIKYSRTNAAEPAAAGVDIDVPLYSKYHVLFQVPSASEASWALQERT